MADCTPDNFRIRFPEFADPIDYTDERIQMFIDDTILHMGNDPSRWCNKYELARCYLTAHLLTKATSTEAGDSSAIAGPINHVSAGGVSVGRAITNKNVGNGDTFYMTTSYGQQFLLLRDGCLFGILTANSYK